MLLNNKFGKITDMGKLQSRFSEVNNLQGNMFGYLAKIDGLLFIRDYKPFLEDFIKRPFALKGSKLASKDHLG